MMGRSASKMSRGAAEMLMACEALALLAIFRAGLALLPARTIIRGITRGRPEAAREGEKAPAGLGRTERQREQDVARRVEWAVAAAARHSVVEFVCFPQALAGYVMLRRRGVASELVYGVARSPEGSLMAHTWLMVGDKFVTGGEQAAEFSEIERWS